MPIATLKQVLDPAKEEGYAVPGFVVLGWEDARSFVAAAEVLDVPVILQAGPGCRAHTPLVILAKMFRYLAESANVPVVCHLDHGYDIEVCLEAIDCGFSSVMFDGSALPISENIQKTRLLVQYAEKYHVSVEGEVGYVGYAQQGERPTQSQLSDPEEVRLFSQESGADALAISIGNVHLQQDKEAEINISQLRAIEAVTDLALVLHGGSGIDPKMRQYLACESRIAKFNIGTEIRMAFGQAVRKKLKEDKTVFDRLLLLKEAEEATRQKAVAILQELTQIRK